MGLATLLWLPAWFLLYNHPTRSKRHAPKNSRSSKAIRPTASEKVSWFKVLAHQETWAYAIGKFLIDPVWWMFLFWLPDFLARTYDMNLKDVRPAARRDLSDL